MNQSYQEQFSIDEFLKTSYVLLKKKIERIFDLTQKVGLSVDEIKEKFEESSKVFKALMLLEMSLDPAVSGFEEMVMEFKELEWMIYKGVHEDSRYLQLVLQKI